MCSVVTRKKWKLKNNSIDIKYLLHAMTGAKMWDIECGEQCKSKIFIVAKSGLISECILNWVPLPTKGAKSFPRAEI